MPWLNWPAWLASNGQPTLKPAGTMRFSLYDQVIQATVAGQGVALGRIPLIAELLNDGRLVAPFPKRYDSPRGYFAVVAPHAVQRPEATAFIDWLRNEATPRAAGGAPAAKRSRPATRRTRRGRHDRSRPSCAIALDHALRASDPAGCARARSCRRVRTPRPLLRGAWRARRRRRSRCRRPRDHCRTCRGSVSACATSRAGRGPFQASVSTRSSWRTICTARCSPILRAALAPDGVLLYETFAMGNEAFGRPTNPDFLLCRDELLTIAALPPARSPWWRSSRAKSTMARAAPSCSGWRPSGRTACGRRCWRRRNHYRLS